MLHALDLVCSGQGLPIRVAAGQRVQGHPDGRAGQGMLVEQVEPKRTYLQSAFGQGLDRMHLTVNIVVSAAAAADADDDEDDARYKYLRVRIRGLQ